jgi:hypothetical protein
MPSICITARNGFEVSGLRNNCEHFVQVLRSRLRATVRSGIFACSIECHNEAAFELVWRPCRATIAAVHMRRNSSAVGFAVLTLAGCNSLLGVDFEGRSRDSAQEPDGGTQGLDGGDSGLPPINVDASADQIDREWTMWRAQQSSSLLDPNANGLVRDTLTNLEWPKAATPDLPYDWESAVQLCEALSFGGFDDFRLPTRIELLSLYAYEETSAVRLKQVLAPKAERYWASTPRAMSADVWSIDFSTGMAGGSFKTAKHRVQCVRGGSAIANVPSVRFQTQGEAVVDRITGLTWQKDVLGGPFTAAEAKTYCSSVRVNGAGLYRVPTVQELHTLVAVAFSAPAETTSFFQSSKRSSGFTLWSTTGRLQGYTGTLCVDFSSGDTALETGSYSYYVRCVKD